MTNLFIYSFIYVQINEALCYITLFLSMLYHRDVGLKLNL